MPRFNRIERSKAAGRAYVGYADGPWSINAGSKAAGGGWTARHQHSEALLSARTLTLLDRKLIEWELRKLKDRPLAGGHGVQLREAGRIAELERELAAHV